MTNNYYIVEATIMLRSGKVLTGMFIGIGPDDKSVKATIERELKEEIDYSDVFLKLNYHREISGHFIYTCEYDTGEYEDCKNEV